ncbi:MULTISPECIES: energy transducer TonB [unclassified Sphingomonas]|uniref:energy transducer TonB n=1 Tax=unclassified Sphingomonas TaxID=196159 RepID=UPI000E76AF02|nr:MULTISPECIES: energy transducer TonB [unclassified Sphingomonas]RKE47503.1 protein TonB [Sphingomonas sp. PP-CC-1A-547]TCM07302.1 protein TonB [Sphingomonas sp. PP-CC-3G-468]
MYGVHSNPRDRLISAASAALLCTVIGYALIIGLGVSIPTAIPDALKTFAVSPKAPPPPPPEKIIPRPANNHRHEGAASPANLRSKATELVVPKPIILPIVPPPPVIATLKPGPGSDVTTGAAPIPGPGTGAGGERNGTGSGRAGNGDGDGGDETRPRLLKGRFKNKDFPNAEAVIGAGGIVGVRYTVETDGSVTHCMVTRSSGNGVLDATTCRLIELRFRYRPWLDAAGRPVRSTVVHNQEWVNQLDPPPSRGN